MWKNYITGICLTKVEKMETKALVLWKITLSKNEHSISKDLTLFFNNMTGYPVLRDSIWVPSPRN